jgi:hypothetical protein
VLPQLKPKLEPPLKALLQPDKPQDKQQPKHQQALTLLMHQPQQVQHKQQALQPPKPHLDKRQQVPPLKAQPQPLKLQDKQRVLPPKLAQPLMQLAPW